MSLTLCFDAIMHLYGLMLHPIILACWRDWGMQLSDISCQHIAGAQLANVIDSKGITIINGVSEC